MGGKLAVSYPSGTFSLYRFEGYDPAIISVGEDGTVKALKVGTTTVTVRTANGKLATATVKVCAAPTFVEFLRSEVEVAVGMTTELYPVIDPGTLATFSYTSSNPSVVTVDGNGKLTGVKPGTATITVKTQNGITNTETLTVKVTQAPSTLDYNDMPTLVIAKGDIITIPEPIAMDANGNVCPSTYTFKSSSSSIAKIGGNKLKGMKAGTVTIKATSYNGKTAFFKLKVSSKPITGVALAYTDLTMYVNEELGYAEVAYLYGQPTGSDINYGSLVYTSSNPNVVFVTEDGYMMALSEGDAVITARSYNGKTASCNVHVKKLSSTLALDVDELELGTSQGYQLNPKFDEGTTLTVEYKSDNPAVATVDANGYILAVGSGNTVITATGPMGLTDSVKVRVLPNPTGISLNAGSLSLCIGEKVTLKPELTADSEEFYKQVSFASSNAAVATVDAKGNVSCLSEGTAVISAETANGLKAQCTVNVLKTGESTSTGFAWQTATIVKGDSAVLDLTLNKQALEYGYKVSSSDPEILEVQENRVVAKKVGNVTLTLTVNSDAGSEQKSAAQSCTVQVVESIKPVFSATEIELQAATDISAEESHAELKLTGIPENLIGTYSLTVEDEALVTYDVETGVVSALNLPGVTRIVCKTYGQEVVCTVTVVNSTKYRALIIGEFNKSGANNDLPFAANNLRGIETTLRNSTVNGEKYSITSYKSNPSKSTIESAIKNTFKDATENDVSLIYIVSHGYDKASVGGYHFGIPGYKSSNSSTFVRSSELMSWISGIKGNVVLILDSCQSGGFVRDCQSRLSAAGNIAVITAQMPGRSASFYVGTTPANQVEFLTQAFCQGLGYNTHMASVMGMAADSNGDNLVTVSEALSYGKSETVSLVESKRSTFNPNSKTGIKVPGIMTLSAFKAWSQVPVTYIPSRMSDVVICGR